MDSPITTCINTNNNLEYLKLAVESVRKNAFYKDQKIIVFAENCTDGTDLWLEEFSKELNIHYVIHKSEIPVGIGGGMDYCVSLASTEYVNIIHSDMWIAPNQDKALLDLYKGISPEERLIASSFRIQPKIFKSDPNYRPGTVFVPVDHFGAYHNNFNKEEFDSFAVEFSSKNKGVEVRKAGGAGFFCRTEDYKWIGGNDPLFAPASFEDMDLFIRMQLEGFTFKMVASSVLYHFSARGSHFRDEAKDNFESKSSRQIQAEKENIKKFVQKWGQPPQEDRSSFVKPIYNTNVKTRIPLL